MPLGFSLKTADQCIFGLNYCGLVYSPCRLLSKMKQAFGIDHWALRN